MSKHEHRITQTAIEVEMLRLAALLGRPMGDQSRTTAARAGLTPHDPNITHATLKHATLKHATQSLAESV